jgi:hypothetical protein
MSQIEGNFAFGTLGIPSVISDLTFAKKRREYRENRQLHLENSGSAADLFREVARLLTR